VAGIRRSGLEKGGRRRMGLIQFEKTCPARPAEECGFRGKGLWEKQVWSMPFFQTKKKK